MFLFSTVLFVEGNPVGYEVYDEPKGRLRLNPAENPNREIDPPVISAHKKEGRWLVEGTRSRDLIDQVIEDVSQNDEWISERISANEYSRGE